jgi:acetolactate synthase I/II/III large subunit
VGAVMANLLPDNAIVSDESNTSGAFSYSYYDAAAPHDWLTLTGGAIGQGLPVAVGAAVACPDRKVINLQADGSAMYTNQSLWTMARENLDVCVVLYNNSSYAILNIELMRVGVDQPGERARSLLDLSNPCLEWTKIAEGMGVRATRATTTEEFQAQFEQAMAVKGPRLIEVVL